MVCKPEKTCGTPLDMGSSTDACASYMPAELRRRRTIEDARLTATRRCFATMLCLDLCSIIVSTCRVVRYVSAVDAAVLPVVLALTSGRCWLLARRRQTLTHKRATMRVPHVGSPPCHMEENAQDGLHKGYQRGTGLQNRWSTTKGEGKFAHRQ